MTIKIYTAEELGYEHEAEALGITFCGDSVRFDMDGDYDAYCCDVTRDEAIAAARAILKHFNVGVA